MLALLGGLGVRQFHEHQQPVGALDQAANCAGIGVAFNGVALSAFRKLPTFNFRWSHMEAVQVGIFAPSVFAFVMPCSFVVGLAPTGDQFPGATL